MLHSKRKIYTGFLLVVVTMPCSVFTVLSKTVVLPEARITVCNGLTHSPLRGIAIVSKPNFKFLSSSYFSLSCFKSIGLEWYDIVSYQPTALVYAFIVVCEYLPPARQRRTVGRFPGHEGGRHLPFWARWQGEKGVPAGPLLHDP